MNIESADGYLNVTGSSFIMRSKTNSNNAVEITPEGITIRGFDGRELVVNGIMSGSRAANIILFNANSDVVYDNMNWNYEGPSTVRTYFIDDQYKGRFLDITTALGVRYDSPAGSARVDIQITTFSGEIVAATNVYVSQGMSEMLITLLRCDLQVLFGSVPDYRNVNLYIQTKTTVNTPAKLAFRTNKGAWNG